VYGSVIASVVAVSVVVVVVVVESVVTTVVVDGTSVDSTEVATVAAVINGGVFTSYPIGAGASVGELSDLCISIPGSISSGFTNRC